MNIIETNRLTTEQKNLVLHLWNEEYPQQLQYQTIDEFDTYLNDLQQPYHLLAVDANDNLMCWAFLFERDGEKWFAIIVDNTIQGQGLGTLLLNLLKEKEPVLNGWVTDDTSYLKRNGTPYESPLPFYLKNDFIILTEVRLETESSLL